jgi:hypothetical protein
MSCQLWHKRTYWGKVERGFDNLKSMLSCRSLTKSAHTETVQTNTDARIEATKHLLLTASRLLSAAKMSEEYTTIIGNHQSSHIRYIKRLSLMASDDDVTY